MKILDNYKMVIATIEKSAGNESVGNQWIETRSFTKDTPVGDIVEWVKFSGDASTGKLIITIDEDIPVADD
jgi:hypothetical protein